MSIPEQVDASDQLRQRAWDCVRRSFAAACRAYARGDDAYALRIGQSLLAQNISAWSSLDRSAAEEKQARLEQLFAEEIQRLSVEVEEAAEKAAASRQPNIVLGPPRYSRALAPSATSSTAASAPPARVPFDDICGMIDALQRNELLANRPRKPLPSIQLSA